MPVKLTVDGVLKKIDVTPGCWWWKGTIGGEGYGELQYQRKNWKAHRFVYQLYGGDLTSPLLRHRCDNRNCVNPAHLLPGTIQDNAQDAVDRNRYASGERHPNSKVTANEVRQIRELLQCKLFTLLEIANFYDVKRSLIAEIHLKRAWRGV